MLRDDLGFKLRRRSTRRPVCRATSSTRARRCALAARVCRRDTLARPLASAVTENSNRVRGKNGYRSSPGRRHGLKTRRGPRKKSVSPLRAFLSLRNAFGMRIDAEKDVTTIEIGRDVLEVN